jgi:phosphatidylinositol alpha-mannosyltransferase
LEPFAGRIAVSSSAKEFISRYYPGDYKIIPNGIDAEHFSGPVEPIPELCDGKINILFVGRLEKRKGLNHLLSAYSVLKMQHTNIRLIVVGPGNIDKEIYGILGARALEDVVFTGAVSYEDLPRYFSAAQIFCSPATGRESFGIVLLEAMAAGKPIVASKIEGYSSVVSDGIDGLLVPPKDEDALIEALDRLLNDSALRKSLGSSGQEKARGYSWVNVSREILDYYQELANGSNRASDNGKVYR